MPDAEPQRERIDQDVYICPSTGARLHFQGGLLVADGTGPTYAVDRGVPNLLLGPPTVQDNTSSLVQLNEAAVRDGWRKALDVVMADNVRYVTSESRLKVLDLLELTRDDVVLDLGASLGTFTVAIGQRSARVFGLEIDPEQARFAAERCRQEGLDNVAVACGGSQCRLPYADETFDAVFFNLVFEWCSWRTEDEPFEAGQKRILAEIHRVLRPGGRMLLSTKNRYAIHYLLGKPDEHAGNMRFGNALPRWLMYAFQGGRSRARQGLHGLLHSHNQLRRMLEQAGFDPPRSYWAAPEMRFPNHYVPTDAPSIRAARRQPGFTQGESRATRLLMPLIPAPIVKHFTRGLLFVSRKPKPR